MRVSEAECGPFKGRGGDLEREREREREGERDLDLDTGLVSLAGERKRGERPRIISTGSTAGRDLDLERDLERESERERERERERES